MKIEIIGRGPITPAQLDEILFGTSTINKKNPLEEAMDKLINEAKRGEAKTIVLDSLGDIMEEIEKDAIGKYSGKPICFDIQSITANHKKNAFTVVWADGSHTIIHLQPGDVWDDEKALTMCFVKHLMGDTGSFNDIFTEEMPAKIKHIGTVSGPTVAEHECHCDTPCDNCSCHAEAEKTAEASTKAAFNKRSEATKKAAKVATMLNDSLSSMLEKFLSTPVPAYDVFVKGSGKSEQIMASAEKDMIGKCLKAYVQKYYPTLVDTPWRIWTVGKEYPEMFIDFGASEYFVIPYMTCEEWNKNN